MSVGGTITAPPSSPIFAAVAFRSGTETYPIQWGLCSPSSSFMTPPMVPSPPSTVSILYGVSPPLHSWMP